LQCAGFDDVLNEAWAINLDGTPMYRVVMKLRFLKLSLKQWCKDGKSFPSENVMHIRKELAKVFKALQSQPLTFDLAKEENKLQAELSLFG